MAQTFNPYLQMNTNPLPDEESILAAMQKEQAANNLAAVTPGEQLTPEESAIMNMQLPYMPKGTTYGGALSAISKTPELQEQKKALESQKALLEAQLKTPAQVDYRPVAALVDAWTGSRFAPATSAPEDKTDLIARLQRQIQTGKQDISEEQRRYLKDVLGLAQVAKQTRGGRGGSGTQPEERLFKQFASQTKEYQKSIDAGRRALVTLAQGGPISQEAVKTMLARASGEVGVLTDRDLDRFRGSPDLLSRAERAIAKAATGHQFTEEDRDEIQALATIYSRRGLEDMEQVKQSFVEGAALMYGADPDRVEVGLSRYLNPIKKRQTEIEKKATDTKKTADTEKSSGDKVEVINPSGVRVRIPARQLESALRQGYKQP